MQRPDDRCGIQIPFFMQGSQPAWTPGRRDPAWRQGDGDPEFSPKMHFHPSKGPTMHRCTPFPVPLVVLLFVFALLPMRAGAHEAMDRAIVISPQDSFFFFVLENGEATQSWEITSWGDKAAWVSPPRSNADLVDGRLDAAGTADFAKKKLAFHVEMKNTQPDTLSWKCALEAKDDGVAVSRIAWICRFRGMKEGSWRLTAGDGSATGGAFPSPAAKDVRNVTKIEIEREHKPSWTLAFDEGVNVTIRQGCEVFIDLAGDGWHKPAVIMPAGSGRSVAASLRFPGACGLVSGEGMVKSLADPTWFEFAPRQVFDDENEISMASWLDAPAGGHGGVRSVGDHFQFEDGTPVKFWGAGVSFSQSAPSKEGAAICADYYARYGINCIRMSQFGDAGWRGIGNASDATLFDPGSIDRFDYFVATLKKRGIYVDLNLNYHFQRQKANLAQLKDFDDKTDLYTVPDIAEDAQDLYIRRIVNLLNHKNPYTGLAYADDPVVSNVTFQNEADIFFYTTSKLPELAPTYARKFEAGFSEWLEKKYGSQEELKRAWGSALRNVEQLAAKNIHMEWSPWTFGSDGLKQVEGNADLIRRRMDNALYFHQTQDRYYARFLKAVRDTGYKGPVVGSNWQAPAMIPQYYNLLSDHLVGTIERHNYFGGDIFDSMLRSPGSGCLSSGLQQVVDRPFALGEWNHVFPTCYTAEGAPLIGAYGMGLQGWANANAHQTHTVDPPFPAHPTAPKDAYRSPLVAMAGSRPWQVWQVDVPSCIGQFPTVVRMVYRGDIKPGEIISVRAVSQQELYQGKLAFHETASQSGDIKDFGGDVPPLALAAGRCVIAFTDQPGASTFPDLSKYVRDSVVTSTTGQLIWDCSEKGGGFFTINSDGTKGIVGFAKGKTQSLGDVTITSRTPYASIILTAMERHKTLKDAKSGLISMVARQSNTGFRYFEPTSLMLEEGHGPLLLEPVLADFSIRGRKIASVQVLDQNGALSEKTIPVADGAFRLDTGKDKTIYYKINFE